MASYKDTKSLAQRIRESSEVAHKYPGRIPIIVEKSRSAHNIPDLDKTKFLCPDSLSVGQFIYVIRRRMVLESDKALFVFVNNTLPVSSALMREVYSQHRDLDGFLYMNYTGESTFGSEIRRPFDLPFRQGESTFGDF
jgi:GABA(A) receptor-associated protein